MPAPRISTWGSPNCGENSEPGKHITESFTSNPRVREQRLGFRLDSNITMERRNVLISAFSCLPNKGSEPGTGWACVRGMARRHHRVWVLTACKNRPAIESALTQSPVPDLHFVYPEPRWFRLWPKMPQSYYYLWQIAAYLCARRLHRQIGFDVVHHIKYVKYWMPSFLSLLPVPFVWGPVGGVGGLGHRLLGVGAAPKTLLSAKISNGR